MEHFRLFVLPFWLGAFFLLVTLLYKYIGWFVGLTAAERRLFVRSLFTRSTFRSVGEVISESLLHRKIWRTNKLLGYMHTSFALGWFLLILTGWIETLVYFKGENVPLYVDIFFSYYVHPIFEHNFNFSLIKDALLLLILIGIGLALFKRIRSRMMGMRRTTRHTPGDRIALSALWLIFPARLLAESEVVFTCLNKNVLLLGREEFARLGAGKVLFNTSIGPGFDSEALEAWLDQPGTYYFCDTRAAAGPVAEGFFERPNVHCANVSAGRTKQAFVLLSQKVLANIEAALAE